MRGGIVRAVERGGDRERVVLRQMERRGRREIERERGEKGRERGWEICEAFEIVLLLKPWREKRRIWKKTGR